MLDLHLCMKVVALAYHLFLDRARHFTKEEDHSASDGSIFLFLSRLTQLYLFSY